MANVYSRPYASAISGTPLLMQYDDETATFTLKYQVSLNLKSFVTEIRTNTVSHYPTGIQVHVYCESGNFMASYVTGDDGLIYIYVEPNGVFEDGEVVTVIISKR